MSTIKETCILDTIDVVSCTQSKVIESGTTVYYNKNNQRNLLALKMALLFKEEGFNFFASVPCGALSPLLAELQETFSEKDFFYLPREDICLAVACGAYLGGRKPVVLMQNSGFGQSINALASLIIPFNIPITLLISNRGNNGQDTEENWIMGKTTKSIIELLNIPCTEVSIENYDTSLDWLKKYSKKGCSTALLLEPTLFGWNVKQ